MWSRLGLPKPDRHIANRRYAETLSAIFDFSSVQRGAAEVRADRLKKPARLGALLHELGNPQQRCPCLLVAGTKGKGSTAAMIASILRAGGLRVGRYTQPHLVSWRERTWVNGRYLSVADTIRLYPAVESAARQVESARPELGSPTTFEVGTAFSLLSFANAGVQAAVVEVGVGGRHDATNALDPKLSVITPISFDHADVIGPGLDDIAHEKAGVMRPGRTVVVGRQPGEAVGVIRAQAHEVGAKPVWVGQDWDWDWHGPTERRGAFDIHGPGRLIRAAHIPLLGDFQRDNATAAVAAVAASGLVPDADLDRSVHEGLSKLVWPGRVHVLSYRPTLIFDGAHNAESARQLVATIHSSFGPARVHWVLGMSRGKDVQGFLEAIRGSACSLTATTASHARSMPAAELADLARTVLGDSQRRIGVDASPKPVKALSAALRSAGDDDVVCAAGSFFLLGDLYSEYVRRDTAD